MPEALVSLSSLTAEVAASSQFNHNVVALLPSLETSAVMPDVDRDMDLTLRNVAIYERRDDKLVYRLGEVQVCESCGEDWEGGRGG